MSMGTTPRNIDPLIKEDDTQNASLSAAIRTSRFCEPSSILVLVTSALYIYIYSYFTGFGERLSIPFIGMDLPLGFYLGTGFQIAMLFLSIALILFLLLMLYKTKIFGILNWGKKEIVYLVIIDILFFFNNIWIYVLPHFQSPTRNLFSKRPYIFSLLA
jgi:hypothetical protein